MGKMVKLKPHEIEYIRKHCMTSTDNELAALLKRDVRTIITARRKLGIHKTIRGKVHNLNTIVSDNDLPSRLPVHIRLTEKDRKQFYITTFSNSLYYKNLQEQFSTEEIDFYLEEWASLCVQFEDIYATEKRQIDELIKAEITGNRILRNIKIAEDEIKGLIKYIEEYRSKHDMTSDEAAQERDNQLMMLVRSLSAQSNAMTTDYQQNVQLRSKLLEQLNARRQDRIDQISRRGTTFLSLVEAFRDQETKEEQGRHMELVRIAKEKKKEQWRKPIVFPDGTKDCVLMDEHSTLPTQDVVLLGKTRLYDLSGKKILVVDDDRTRIQFFQEKLKDNTIDIASNADNAIDKLKSQQYDAICLDYDLGLETKGLKVAEYIVENNYNKEAPILIHSMNKHGSSLMKQLLEDERMVDVVPFEELKHGQNSKS